MATMTRKPVNYSRSSSPEKKETNDLDSQQNLIDSGSLLNSTTQTILKEKTPSIISTNTRKELNPSIISNLRKDIKESTLLSNGNDTREPILLTTRKEPTPLLRKEIPFQSLKESKETSSNKEMNPEIKKSKRSPSITSMLLPSKTSIKSQLQLLKNSISSLTRSSTHGSISHYDTVNSLSKNDELERGRSLNKKDEVVNEEKKEIVNDSKKNDDIIKKELMELELTLRNTIELIRTKNKTSFDRLNKVTESILEQLAPSSINHINEFKDEIKETQLSGEINKSNLEKSNPIKEIQTKEIKVEEKVDMNHTNIIVTIKQNVKDQNIIISNEEKEIKETKLNDASKEEESNFNNIKEEVVRTSFLQDAINKKLKKSQLIAQTLSVEKNTTMNKMEIESPTTIPKESSNTNTNTSNETNSLLKGDLEVKLDLPIETSQLVQIVNHINISKELIQSSSKENVIPISSSEIKLELPDLKLDFTDFSDFLN